MLAHPPKHAKAGGDKSLQKRCNEQQGIFHNRPVYAPAPLADDQAMRAAARKLLNGRTIDVAVPTADGYSGAAWDFRDVCRDVFKGVAGNIRPLAAGAKKCSLGAIRRVWLGFDALSWTARNGLCRWCARSPDTKDKHNDPKFARDGITYAGEDKNEGLVAASKIGGDHSLRKITDAGVVVTKVKKEKLPQSVREDLSDAGLAMAECLLYETQICIPCGPEGEQQFPTNEQR